MLIVFRYLLGRPSERQVFIPCLPEGFELGALAFLIDAEFSAAVAGRDNVAAFFSDGHGRAAARRKILGSLFTWHCDVRQRRIRVERDKSADFAALRMAAFSSELRRNFSVSSFGIELCTPILFVFQAS